MHRCHCHAGHPLFGWLPWAMFHFCRFAPCFSFTGHFLEQSDARMRSACPTAGNANAAFSSRCSPRSAGIGAVLQEAQHTFLGNITLCSIFFLGGGLYRVFLMLIYCPSHMPFLMPQMSWHWKNSAGVDWHRDYVKIRRIKPRKSIIQQGADIFCEGILLVIHA